MFMSDRFWPYVVRSVDANHHPSTFPTTSQDVHNETTFRVPAGTGWSEAGYSLRFVLPAVASGDFTLTVRAQRLHLSGHREEPAFLAHDAHASYAMPYGRFERSVELPAGLDAGRLITNFHHGVLDVTVPFAEGVRPQASPAPVRAESTWAVPAWNRAWACAALGESKRIGVLEQPRWLAMTA